MPIEWKKPEEMTDEELYDEQTMRDYVNQLPRDLRPDEVTDLGMIFAGRIALEQMRREKLRQEQQQPRHS